LAETAHNSGKKLHHGHIRGEAASRLLDVIEIFTDVTITMSFIKDVIEHALRLSGFVRIIVLQKSYRSFGYSTPIRPVRSRARAIGRGILIR